MATIRNRGKYQWQAIVKRKGYPLQSKTFNTSKEAERWARSVEAEMDKGVFVSRDEAEKNTVHDLIDRYRKDVLPTKRANWIAGALGELDLKFGKFSLAALTPKLIATQRDVWLKSSSTSTVRQRIGLLSRLIDLAGREWGIQLHSNPCSMVSKPVERNARDRRLEAGEAALLIAESELNVGYLIVVALETSARLGELLALNWADVDVDERVMIVRGKEHHTGQRTKNEDLMREVPLSPTAIAALEDIKALREAEETEKAEEPKDEEKEPSGRIFRWWKGSDSFNKTWTRVCRRSSIQDLRFHDLRHEATSRLFELGVFDSMEVASITGHKTLTMLKRYTHLKAQNLAKKLG